MTAQQALAADAARCGREASRLKRNVGLTETHNVATDPTLDPRLIMIWRFVRGDLDAAVFERWAYEHSDDLEGMIGKQDALYVLAADYRLTEAIALVKARSDDTPLARRHCAADA